MRSWFSSERQAKHCRWFFLKEENGFNQVLQEEEDDDGDGGGGEEAEGEEEGKVIN